MIPTLGHVAVVVGLAVTLGAAAIFALAGRRNDRGLFAIGRRAMTVAFGLAALASATMVVSLLTHDFSVQYVGQHSVAGVSL